MHVNCVYKYMCMNICERIYINTSGGYDRFNVCMFREGFHAFFLRHVEDQTLLDQVLHLHTHIYIESNIHTRQLYIYITHKSSSLCMYYHIESLKLF